MLTDFVTGNETYYRSVDEDVSCALPAATPRSTGQRPLFGDNRMPGGEPIRLPRGRADRAGIPSTVAVMPTKAATRRTASWPGMAAELVELTGYERIQFRFRAPVHLLVIYEQGVRRAGETQVEGLPSSSLRDFTRKLTFVPAGHDYRETIEPRTLARLVYVYFDATDPELKSKWRVGDATFAPRLFFEDTTLWDTALKLKRLIQESTAEDPHYLEAVGAVLVHELMRLSRGGARAEPLARGGLAAWQKRVVAGYIEEHLAEPISLATLAQLVHLSPYHFCRTFKQSFGMPPHRYHTSRRIERAKQMLVKPAFSVTDIGLTVGFSETSSFTAAFRKATGLTPTAYHRSFG
ncbi:MAG TPA: AraC family transcriptional regulator [Alphaproteobacteria bacterium]|jgi:AraC family transcriptional regulator|nr:AraC family transcriptional regulator [Alphaproteobacteria bacterium]